MLASGTTIYVNSIKDTGIPYAVAAGTSTAYTATLASSISTLASGTSLHFLVPTTNASSVTLNVNSLGAKSITKLGTKSLASGDLITGQVAEVIYDGTEFQLNSPVNPSTPKFGNTSHDVSVTGSQTIAHGLGKTPSYIRIYATTTLSDSNYIGASVSYGMYDGTNTNTNYSYSATLRVGTSNNGVGGSGIDTTNILNLVPNNGASSTATVTFDATNITLTWSKSNTPTGTANLVWEAYS
jgi:hypothetical protein